MFDVANPLLPARVVSVDASGDVVVGGTRFRTLPGSDAVVVKLAGADGHVLWRVEFDGAGPIRISEHAASMATATILGGTTDVGHASWRGSTAERSGRRAGRAPEACSTELQVAVKYGDVALVGGFTNRRLAHRYHGAWGDACLAQHHGRRDF